MSILAPIHIIGASSSGNPFSFGTGREGFLLQRIGVWAGEWQLRGIRVWWTNGQVQTYGTPNSGPYQDFEFIAGERFQSLSLWGNGAGTRSGGIRFRTTRGREFFHHMTRWSLQQEFSINVSSGLCVGIRGRSGEDIDALGFAFLLPVARARMINVSYPTLHLETAGIQPVTIEEFRDENRSFNSSQDWSNTGSFTMTQSSSWSVTAGIEYHFTVSVTAGIPMVGEGSAQAGWVLSVSGMYSTTHEETTTREWVRSGTIAPREWLTFLVTTRRGVISVPYHATMEITLTTGAIFTYPLQGLYSGVNFTSLHFQVDSGSLDARATTTFSATTDGGKLPLQPHLNVTSDHTKISSITASTTSKLSGKAACIANDIHSAKVGSIERPLANNTVNELHVMEE